MVHRCCDWSLDRIQLIALLREYKLENMMSDAKKSEGESRRGLKDDEVAAVIVAVSIVVFFAVYWFFEIMSVRELLEMAYG